MFFSVPGHAPSIRALIVCLCVDACKTTQIESISFKKKHEPLFPGNQEKLPKAPNVDFWKPPQVTKHKPRAGVPRSLCGRTKICKGHKQEAFGEGIRLQAVFALFLSNRVAHNSTHPDHPFGLPWVRRVQYLFLDKNLFCVRFFSR